MALPKNLKGTTPASTRPVVGVTSNLNVSSPTQTQRSELKGSGTTKPFSTPIPRHFTQEDISRRAYEIYANRGYAPGDPVADWYEAERQLKAGL